MKSAIRKVLSLIIAFTFIFQQAGFAQGLAQIDIAKYLSQAGAFSSPQNFRPLHLRYFSYDPLTDNFRILLDKGSLKTISDNQLKEESQELLKYFLIGVSLPDDKFWVNLRPDSEDQIIGGELDRTDLGKVLLETDLQLKKDVARFTSPETMEGREYWDKLYKKAGELFGMQNLTIPTLTRPWIVPGEVIIRETDTSAYVYKATLKVMLEEDHLSRGQGTGDRGQGLTDYTFNDPRIKELNEYSSQLIRQEIIPKLTKEVNSSAKYAPLRQVFYSLILSRWFKSKFAGKTGTYSNLINSGNLTGLTSKQEWSKTTYFKEYQNSFQQGEYNLKEQVNAVMGPTIRTYFSGGFDGTDTAFSAASGKWTGRSIPVSNALENNGLIPIAGAAGKEELTVAQGSSPVASTPVQARRPFVVGNWEMELGTREEAYQLLSKLADQIGKNVGVEVVIAPSDLHIPVVSTVLRDLVRLNKVTPGAINIAAQNMYAEEGGAFTGGTSAAQLKDYGVTHVILGHSEVRRNSRQELTGESNANVNRKAKTALKNGLIPIVVVGESDAEREAGQYRYIVETMVKESLAGISSQDAEKVIIAYQPVWAIGTGKSATPEQAEMMHKFIMDTALVPMFGLETAHKIRIIYGGSVKPENAEGFRAIPGIDGFLVGEASLNPDSFSSIVQKIAVTLPLRMPGTAPKVSFKLKIEEGERLFKASFEALPSLQQEARLFTIFKAEETRNPVLVTVQREFGLRQLQVEDRDLLMVKANTGELIFIKAAMEEVLDAFDPGAKSAQWITADELFSPSGASSPVSQLSPGELEDILTTLENFAKSGVADREVATRVLRQLAGFRQQARYLISRVDSFWPGTILFRGNHVELATETFEKPRPARRGWTSADMDSDYFYRGWSYNISTGELSGFGQAAIDDAFQATTRALTPVDIKGLLLKRLSSLSDPSRRQRLLRYALWFEVKLPDTEPQFDKKTEAWLQQDGDFLLQHATPRGDKPVQPGTLIFDESSGAVIIVTLAWDNGFLRDQVWTGWNGRKLQNGRWEYVGGQGLPSGRMVTREDLRHLIASLKKDASASLPVAHIDAAKKLLRKDGPFVSGVAGITEQYMRWMAEQTTMRLTILGMKIPGPLSASYEVMERELKTAFSKEIPADVQRPLSELKAAIDAAEKPLMTFSEYTNANTVLEPTMRALVRLSQGLISIAGGPRLTEPGDVLKHVIGEQKLRQIAASSPIANSENIFSPAILTDIPSAASPVGGIDFRVIPMITQPMGNLSGLSFSLPQLSNLESINLDEEFSQLQNMLQAGITPSGERLKEYVAACYQKGELKTHLEGIVATLVDTCKLEEEKVDVTSDATKEVMLILDAIS